MLDIIRGCGKIAHDLRGRVRRERGDRIGKEEIRDLVRGTVDGYFRTDRPILIAELPDPAAFADIDRLMQELLQLAQGRSRRSRYLEILGALERAWKQLELYALPRASAMIGGPPRNANQERIAATLEAVCPPAAACYRQGIRDLLEERISWRGTASELREALRELLDQLAPDAEVEASTGFKYEDGLKKPTMKQKVRFILKSRQWSESQRKQMEDAASVVEEKVGSFVRSVYGGSSSSVHTEPTKKEVISVLRFVDTCLAELLEVD